MSGHESLGSPVRWVHTSEIFGIAPLLQGGEILLTTGLGLVGLRSPEVREYVRSLRGRGVAALFLELGRTFPEPPEGLLEEARKEGLCVVLLNSVVPFIRVTETVHAMLVDSQVSTLRLQADVVASVARSLASPDSLRAVVADLHSEYEADLSVHNDAGAPLAWIGDEPPLLPVHSLAEQDLPPEIRPLRLRGAVIGYLHARSDLPAGLGSALAAAAELIALEVHRRAASRGSRELAARSLFADIDAGRYASTSAIAARAADLGFLVRPGQRAVALCVDVLGRGQASAAHESIAREVARRAFGLVIVGEHEGVILVAAAVNGREVRSRALAFTESLGSELAATTGGRPVVGVGPLVEDVGGLVRSLHGARETVQIAQRISPGAALVFSADVAIHRLLSTVTSDDALERLVRESLGPLLEYDARRGTELVRTLDVYLNEGMSKVHAAAALGIRRQTLYGRIERIATILGGLDLDNREHRLAIELALVGWRVRVTGLRDVRPR